MSDILKWISDFKRHSLHLLLLHKTKLICRKYNTVPCKVKAAQRLTWPLAIFCHCDSGKL